MIITLISFKGGVGKSTVSQNLAVAFAHRGKDVCIIDADPNESTTAWQEFRPDDLPKVAVFPLGNQKPTTAIDNLKDKYDIVIVDCPPAIEKTTSLAVMKSDFSLIPLPPTGGSDLWATQKFLDHLEMLRAKMDEELPAYFITNKYEKQVVMHQQIVATFGDYVESHKIHTLETVLHKRVEYGKANIQGRGAIEGKDPKAKAEVNALIDELETIINTIS